MPRTDGGLLSCWRQTVRKRGSILKKKYAKMYDCLGNEKRLEKKDGRIASANGKKTLVGWWM